MMTVLVGISESLFYIFFLISIGLSFSVEANKIKFLNIERT